MKIMQDVLALLTVPRAPFIDIFFIISTGVEIFMYFLIVPTLIGCKLSFRKNIIFVFVLTLISYLFSLKIAFPYYNFIILLITITLTVLTSKLSLFKVSFGTLYFCIISLFFRMVWTIFYRILFNCTIDVFNQAFIYKIILFISVNVSYFVFYTFCNKYPLSNKLFVINPKHNLLFCNVALCFFAVTVQFFISCLYFDHIPFPLNIFSCILFLIYFLVNMYSLYRTKKLETTTLLLEKEKLYNKNLSTLNDNIRGFKHDFNNIVQSLGGYISTNNMSGLKTYYKDLLDDCQVNNNLAELNPEAINNPAIYSLLTDKYYKAINVEVKIDFTILSPDLSFLNYKTYELSRILGILLDNAIEASSKAENKLVHVTLRKDKLINKNLIIIENTYINKDINIDKIFEKGYSSKKDKLNHGIGLWEVNNYIQRRSNLNLVVSKSEDYFKQELQISAS